MKKSKNNGEITEAQIDSWKTKYRKIYEIEVEDGSETLVGYFRRPDHDTMAAATTVAQKDTYKASGVLFENCWLGGAAEIKEDAVVKMAVFSQLDKILLSCTGSIKNL